MTWPSRQPLISGVLPPASTRALASTLRSALTQGADMGLLDGLVLETSGAAGPAAHRGGPEVRFGPLARVRLDRVVTVVDAERLMERKRERGGGAAARAALGGGREWAAEQGLEEYLKSILKAS